MGLYIFCLSVRLVLFQANISLSSFQTASRTCFLHVVLGRREGDYL